MARTTKPAVTAEQEKKEARFTVEQLVSSKTFAARRDVAIAVLATGKTYTVAEANNAIDNFYERRVN